MATIATADVAHCPASGDTPQTAISTPPLHSQAELFAIRYQIEPTLGPPQGAWTSIGVGQDAVEITLAPGREDLAAQLVARYGDVVRIHVGSELFVPAGCGTAPPPKQCGDLNGAPPSTAHVRLSIVLDAPTLQPSIGGAGSLKIHNIGTRPFSIDPGSTIVASLVRPGTRHVVGEYPFGIAGTAAFVTVAAGKTARVAIAFGAARCDGKPGSALPPGRYGVRLVLEPEGLVTAHLEPRLLSPETLVTVTK